MTCIEGVILLSRNDDLFSPPKTLGQKCLTLAVESVGILPFVHQHGTSSDRKCLRFLIDWRAWALSEKRAPRSVAENGSFASC